MVIEKNIIHPTMKHGAVSTRRIIINTVMNLRGYGPWLRVDSVPMATHRQGVEFLLNRMVALNRAVKDAYGWYQSGESKVVR